MKSIENSLSRRLLSTFVPPLLFFLIYRVVVYIYLSRYNFLDSKDWGYLIVIITTATRTIRLFFLSKIESYQKMMRWRTLGHDILAIVLAPSILLPIVGITLLMQFEFQLMIIVYCCIFIASKQLLQHL